MVDTPSNASPTLSALLSSSSSTSTFDASTQLSTNRAVGTLLDNLSGGNTDVVAVLNDIAGAITSSIIGGSTGATANALLRANGTGGISLKSGVITEDDSGNLANVNSISLPFAPNRLVVSGPTSPGALTTLGAGTSGQLLVSRGSATSPAYVTLTDGISILIPFPIANQPYFVWIQSPFTFTTTSITTVCLAGSATLSFTSNSGVFSIVGATSTQTQTAATVTVSLNSGFIGVTPTAVSGCQYLTIMIAYTRLL